MTYLESIAAQIQRSAAPEALPDEDTRALFLGYAVLLLAKGDAVTHEDVHNAWTAWMVGRGERHESMIPFNELPPDTKAEDSPFVEAIRAVARQRSTASDPMSSGGS